MIILSSGAWALLEVISVRAINWISQYTSRSKTIKSDISFNKCGLAMASGGNINRGIQLIIDVIDCKMLKGKYLVGMLSADYIISQCDYKLFCAVISTYVR